MAASWSPQRRLPDFGDGLWLVLRDASSARLVDIELSDPA